MRDTKLIARLLDRYGTEGEVFWNGDSVFPKMFVQPMRYKNKMYLNSEITGLGTIDESCYLYIGVPDYLLKENTTKCIVKFDNTYYMVVKAETVYCMHQPVYTWAILRILRMGDD